MQILRSSKLGYPPLSGALTNTEIINYLASKRILGVEKKSQYACLIPVCDSAEFKPRTAAYMLIYLFKKQKYNQYLLPLSGALLI